jgi:2-methylisocitrate lyase-like PEP mutase family enzyme
MAEDLSWSAEMSDQRPTQAEKGETFRALHEGEPFVIPNPWDGGSARAFEAMGFKALASTSGGHAFTLGRMDGSVTLDEVADHVRLLSTASGLPVSADLENGYGAEAEAAARAITRAAEAGAVGGSIEDWDRDEGNLYELDQAAERVAAAAEAVRGLDFSFTLTGRAENYFRDNPDLDDTIARLQAYERAGADVLYAPGLRSAEEIRAVADAVSKPLNVLALRRFTMDDIVEAGGQRVSVGGALTFVGMAAVASAAETIRDTGDFTVLEARVPLHDWLG